MRPIHDDMLMLMMITSPSCVTRSPPPRWPPAALRCAKQTAVHSNVLSIATCCPFLTIVIAAARCLLPAGRLPAWLVGCLLACLLACCRLLACLCAATAATAYSPRVWCLLACSASGQHRPDLQPRRAPPQEGRRRAVHQLSPCVNSVNFVCFLSLY